MLVNFINDLLILSIIVAIYYTTEARGEVNHLNNKLILIALDDLFKKTKTYLFIFLKNILKNIKI